MTGNKTLIKEKHHANQKDRSKHYNQIGFLYLFTKIKIMTLKPQHHPLEFFYVFDLWKFSINLMYGPSKGKISQWNPQAETRSPDLEIEFP